MKQIICIYGIMICCFEVASIVAQTNDADCSYAAYEYASDKKVRLLLARESNNNLRVPQYTSVGDSAFNYEQTKVKLDELKINTMTLYACHQTHYCDILKYGEKGMALSRIVGDSIDLLSNLELISNADQSMGQMGNVFDYVQQTIDLRNFSNDEYGVSISYHIHGMTYFLNEYYEVADVFAESS